jgi:hypothetical protein
MGKRSSMMLVAALAMLVFALGCNSDSPTTVVDTVAPAAILDLDGNLEAGVQPGIVLTWVAGSEPDLSGYNVYRSMNGGAWQIVSIETAPTFRDGTVVRGSGYRYAVSAFDTSSNESPRVMSRILGFPVKKSPDLSH